MHVAAQGEPSPPAAPDETGISICLLKYLRASRLCLAGIVMAHPGLFTKRICAQVHPPHPHHHYTQPPTTASVLLLLPMHAWHLAQPHDAFTV